MEKEAAYTAKAATEQPEVPAGPLRVMVVDDSAVQRGLVSRWIGDEAGLALAGAAASGRQAIESVTAHRPDVILLDIEMPDVDGLAALPVLRKLCPSAKVLMVSALTKRNAYATFQALSLGAADYLPKPDGSALSLQNFRRELIAKVRMLGELARGAGVARSVRRAGASRGATPAGALRPFSCVVPRIVAIGSSTGGPDALLRLLSPLGPSLAKVPVLVTQHMPPVFTALLAERVGLATGLAAKEGEDGEALAPGTIYVAPGDRHMAVRPGEKLRLSVHDGPPCNFHRPAVDLLFRSVAEAGGAASLGVVLSGMGQDGLKGASEIAEAGGSVIVQDQYSSAVWGMPGAVHGAGLASAALPPEALGGLIHQLLRGERP